MSSLESIELKLVALLDEVRQLKQFSGEKAENSEEKGEYELLQAKFVFADQRSGVFYACPRPGDGFEEVIQFVKDRYGSEHRVLRALESVEPEISVVGRYHDSKQRADEKKRLTKSLPQGTLNLNKIS